MLLSFRVAPGVRDCYMVVECSGETDRFKSAMYTVGKKDFFRNPIDLGDIDLRKGEFASER